jgi:hypothetical protein
MCTNALHSLPEEVGGMSAWSDIQPLEYPNYSMEARDGYVYERVRIAEDYYLVAMSGMKSFTSEISGSFASIPTAYRPMQTRSVASKFLNDQNGNMGNTNVQATSAGEIKALNGNIIKGSYVALSGSWIHKGH